MLCSSCAGLCVARRPTPSAPFVAGDQAIALAATAKLFAQRPSSLAAIQDPVTALEFDLALAAVAIETSRLSSSDDGRVTQIWL